MTPAEPSDAGARTAITHYAIVGARRRPGRVAGPGADDRPHPPAARPHARLGHPILGDRKYSTPRSLALAGDLPLQLHARRLVLPHPAGGTIDIEAPLGPGMEAGFARFGFDPGTAPADPFAALGAA